VIDSLRALFTEPGFPSLHVLVIHFPIALLALAPLFDIGCMIFRDRVWLDRAAAALYVMGTIGAGAAYLTGERAARAAGDLGTAAESALADHENFAVLTLFALAVVTLARVGVIWLARHDRRVTIGVFRLAALPIALAGLVMLALTADRGGRLVYHHGVGVNPQNVETLER
jgi:uncharacterized membrane protein